MRYIFTEYGQVVVDTFANFCYIFHQGSLKKSQSLNFSLQDRVKGVCQQELNYPSVKKNTL